MIRVTDPVTPGFKKVTLVLWITRLHFLNIVQNSVIVGHHLNPKF